MAIEFTGKKGAKIVINAGDFKSAIALKNAIEREMVSANGGSDVAMLISSSDAVYNALFSCLERSTYNNEKITEKTFENLDNREDYPEVSRLCMEANITPFFPNLASKLLALLKTYNASDTQK